MDDPGLGRLFGKTFEATLVRLAVRQ